MVETYATCNNATNATNAYILYTLCNKITMIKIYIHPIERKLAFRAFQALLHVICNVRDIHYAYVIRFRDFSMLEKCSNA